MAEKRFKVLTVKEKHYKKVRDFYRSVLNEERGAEEFIREARAIQEDIKKSKVGKPDPLKVKRIWEADA